MTPEIFARRFASFLLGRDTALDITDEELELLAEVGRLAEDPLGQARMREIIRSLHTVLHRRTLSVETVAQGLMVPASYVVHLAESGRLRGTLTPAGWRFSPDGVYQHVFPEEGLARREREA